MRLKECFTRVTNLTSILIIACLTQLILPGSPIQAGPQNGEQNILVQLELGPVWQTRNDVQIPNNQDGTRFSLVDLVGSGPFPAGRLYLTWHIARRHDLRLLLAPLSYNQTGTFNEPVSFAGQTFTPDQSIDGNYKFNSWRLTYRYKFHDGTQWHWWIGFTAKIRDARIKLVQGSVSSEKTDLGFVPLLHLQGRVDLNDRWWLRLDIDALAGGPGRAEDAALQVGFNFSDTWAIASGYRTVEGGADVEEVYNFAWLHFFTVSVEYGF